MDEKEYSISQPAEAEQTVRNAGLSSRNRNLFVIVGMVVLVGAVALFMWPSHESATKGEKRGAAEGNEAREHYSEGGNEVELSPATLAAAGIEIVSVTERPAIARLRVTGAVEANQ